MTRMMTIPIRIPKAGPLQTGTQRLLNDGPGRRPGWLRRATAARVMATGQARKRAAMSEAVKASRAEAAAGWVAPADSADEPEPDYLREDRRAPLYADHASMGAIEEHPVGSSPADVIAEVRGLLAGAEANAEKWRAAHGGIVQVNRMLRAERDFLGWAYDSMRQRALSAIVGRDEVDATIALLRDDEQYAGVSTTAWRRTILLLNAYEVIADHMGRTPLGREVHFEVYGPDEPEGAGQWMATTTDTSAEGDSYEDAVLSLAATLTRKENRRG